MCRTAGNLIACFMNQGSLADLNGVSERTSFILANVGQVAHSPRRVHARIKVGDDRK